MQPNYYRVLMEVHTSTRSFHKGQRLTVAEMGPDAFILIHYSLAIRDVQVSVALTHAA